MLDYLQIVVHYNSAHVELLDGEDQLIVRVARGEEEWDAENRLLGKTMEVNDLPIFSPLLQKRQIVECANTNDFLGCGIFHGNQYIGSWLALPLLTGDQVIGLCVLEHTESNFFTPTLTKWAKLLTDQAAVAFQNAWLYEQVRDGRARLQALSRRLVEVQESERLYIARELHDEAGQALASLMIGLRHLEQTAADRPPVLAQIKELKQIADRVLEDLHRLAMDLKPASLDHLGLVPALRQHTETIRNQHDLSVQFEVVGQIERLPDEMETAIYRIVQEALTNVVRHSHAQRAAILLERRTDSLLIIIEDDGIGFDSKFPAANQLGMVGMRERAEMLGGMLRLECAPAGGSTIVLEVPCPSGL